MESGQVKLSMQQKESTLEQLKEDMWLGGDENELYIGVWFPPRPCQCQVSGACLLRIRNVLSQVRPNAMVVLAVGPSLLLGVRFAGAVLRACSIPNHFCVGVVAPDYIEQVCWGPHLGCQARLPGKR